MQYAIARKHIKTGDILAWSHRGWHSWYDFQIQLVRMFTRSEYSHVGIAWVAHERVFVIEAVGSGVRIFPLSNQLPCYWLGNQQSLQPHVLEWLMAQVGFAYESKLKMVWSFLTGHKLKSNQRWQCSELVNMALVLNAQNLQCDDTPSAVVEAALHAWPSGLLLLE